MQIEEPLRKEWLAATLELLGFGWAIGTGAYSMSIDVLWLMGLSALMSMIFALNLVERIFKVARTYAISAAVAKYVAEGLDKHGCGDVDCTVCRGKKGEANG